MNACACRGDGFSRQLRSQANELGNPKAAERQGVITEGQQRRIEDICLSVANLAHELGGYDDSPVS